MKLFESIFRLVSEVNAGFQYLITNIYYWARLTGNSAMQYFENARNEKRTIKIHVNMCLHWHENVLDNRKWSWKWAQKIQFRTKLKTWVDLGFLIIPREFFSNNSFNFYGYKEMFKKSWTFFAHPIQSNQ